MLYTAQRQSLYGVGSPGYINRAPDVGGVIDAIAGSANSLVQQAYMRRLQQHEEARRDQEFALSQQRESREAAAQNRQLAIAEEGNRIRKIQAGVVPPHDEVSMETPAPTLPKPVSSAAMISGLPAQGGTSPLTRPVDLGTSQMPKLVTKHVDESYDPTRSAQYIRTIGAIGARATVTDEQIDRRNKGAAARQSARDQNTAARQKAHDERVAATKNNPKSMTAGQRATWGQKTGDALLQEHGGSFEDARDWLNSEEGKDLRDRGLTETDLYLAHGRATGRLAQSAAAYTKGPDAVSPDSAVAIARNVGAAARAQSGGKKPNATPTGGSNYDDVQGGSSMSSRGAKTRYTPQQIETFYQDALKKGADPAKAKARRDSLLKAP